MPITRSAIKKLRQDKKREALNQEFEKKVKDTIRKAEKTKKPEIVKEAISLVDKAVKKHLFHKNKSARIKSFLSKLAKTEGKVKKAEVKTAKKTTKKSTTKNQKKA